MARSWASASSRSSSSSYQFVGRDPLDDDEELVVLPSGSLLESSESDERRVTEASNVTEASDGGGNGRRATSLQDSHLAAASAEEDFAADWILGSSNYYFQSAPASAQPLPAPSALPSSPPEAAPEALPSGPESPHLAPTLGERSCGHGECEGMMHCAGTGGSISFARESCSSAWSDGGKEGQQAEECLAGNLLGSQEKQQQQQQQQQQGSPLGSEQQQQYSGSSSEQGYVVSSGDEGGGVRGLLASLASLEQERDVLAVRVLDTDSALSASEGALRSLSAQHASTRTLLAELASHALFSTAPPPLPTATAGATAAGAALPNEPQPPASPQQGPAPPGQASPSESLEGSGTAAAAQDGPAADTGSFPCPSLNAGAASAATAQDMVRDAIAGAEIGDSEGPAFGALLLLALFGLAWLLGAAPPSAMHDLPTSPTAQRPHDPSPAAPAPAPSPPPVSPSPLTLQQPLQQTFPQQQQQQQQEEQCAAVPTDGHSYFPTIAECSSVACADAGAGVGAFLPCSAPSSGPGADVAEGSSPACTALASSPLVPSVTHGKGLSSALVQRLSGGLMLQETRAGSCSCSSSSSSSSKTSTSLAQKLVGTQLMLWGSEGVGSRSLVSQGAHGSVACRQELFGYRAFPGFHGFHSDDMNFDEGDDNGGERQRLGSGGWAALMSPAAPDTWREGQEGGARSLERTAVGSGAGILSSSHHMGFEPITYTALRSRSRFNDEERASNLAGMRSGGKGTPVPCQQWRMGSRNAKAALPSELTTALPAQQYHRAELGALTAMRFAHPSSCKVPREHAAGAAQKAAQHTGVACSSNRAATHTICKTAVAVEPRNTCKALAVVPHSSGALALTPTPHHRNTFARPASSAPPTQSDIIARPHKTNPHANKLATIPENHQHAKSPAVGSSSSKRGPMSSGTSALASSSSQPGPSSSSETAATLGGLSRAQARRSLGKRQHQQQHQQLLQLEKESKQKKREGWKESKQQAKRAKKVSRKPQKCV